MNGTGPDGLVDARVLVVGASAGIGRSVAVHAAALGAHVCVAARRLDKLAEVCAEAGGATALAADVTDPGACSALVADAAAQLGGLDIVVYAAGGAGLSAVEANSADAWRSTLDVNTVGANLVCAAALDMMDDDGLMVFLSSEAATSPRWGLATYAASKAALDNAIDCWRLEHPHRRFVRVTLGATMPTEFGHRFNPETFEVAFERWVASGIAMNTMETSDVGGALAELLAIARDRPGIDLRNVRLDPRGRPWTS